jgi:Tol biopolymer transport system component
VIAGVVAVDRWRSDGGETAKLQNQGPIVTWPTFEFGSRVSPDGKAVTFISRQHGKSRLWIRSVDGRDPVAIGDVRDRLKTPAWSPDGQQIACLVPVDNQAHVQFISVWGETTAPPKPLGGAWDDVALVRWIGTHIYFSKSAGSSQSLLWRYDTRDGTTHQVTDPSQGKRFTASGDTVNIDVRADEARTVLIDRAGALWTADLDGQNAESIALEASLVITPRWRGADGQRIVYVSNENGQSDIWEYNLGSRRRSAVTTSPLEEESVDVSTAGDVLVADTVAQIAHLWAVNPSSNAAPRQLTNDSRSDVSPSLAAAGDRLVFNRRRSSFVQFATFDTDLVFARWNDARLSIERVVGPGASVDLSPDGQHMVFVRWPAENSRTPELWIQELDASKPAVLLSDRFWFRGIDIGTWSLLGQTTAWGSAGSREVFLVRRAPEGSAGFELVRTTVDAEFRGTATVLAKTTNNEDSFTDLEVSPDGKALAFVSSSRRPYRGGKLFWLDLENRDSTPRSILEQPDGIQLHIAGWTRRGTVIAAGAWRPDRGIGSDVFEVGRSGTVRHVATAEGVLGVTARLDAARDRMFATTINGGVATVTILALSDGRPTQLVSNEIDGISFGSYTPTPDGWLLYMRKEINYNPWLFDFRTGSASTALQGGR